MNAILELFARDTSLKRAGNISGGEYAGPCPFCGGTDRFRLWPEEDRFWCRRCDVKGDAIDYLRRRDGLTFRQAKEALGRPMEDRPAKPAQPAEVLPFDGAQAAAMEAWSHCFEALYLPQGRRALRWLEARGISWETAQRWRLGYCEPRERLGNSFGRTIAGLWVPAGITIPWILGDTVWQIKVRLARRTTPKYLSVKGSRPCLFGDVDSASARRVTFLVEGEFDCMLLHQECGDLAGVMTLGSASARPSRAAREHLVCVRRFLVAYDADEAGQQGGVSVCAMSRRMRRVVLPTGKDVTEAWQAGVNLRAWAEECLAGEVRHHVAAH